MAWRPGDWVLQGEIDNTSLGWTTGWIKIQGRDERLQLKLAGNCHPDLAGWKFRVVRTDPIPEWVGPIGNLNSIVTNQSGYVGDVTAEQMLKHFECSSGEFVRRCQTGGMPQTTWRKALYLEWFDSRNGRVVIQSTRLVVERVGERAFELTEEEWGEQARRNAEELSHFLLQVGDVLEDLQDGNEEDLRPQDGSE